MNFQTVWLKQKKSRAGHKEQRPEKSWGGMNRAIFLPGAACGYSKNTA